MEKEVKERDRYLCERREREERNDGCNDGSGRKAESDDVNQYDDEDIDVMDVAVRDDYGSQDGMEERSVAGMAMTEEMGNHTKDQLRSQGVDTVIEKNAKKR